MSAQWKCRWGIIPKGLIYRAFILGSLHMSWVIILDLLLSIQREYPIQGYLQKVCTILKSILKHKAPHVSQKSFNSIQAILPRVTLIISISYFLKFRGAPSSGWYLMSPYRKGTQYFYKAQKIKQYREGLATIFHNLR